MRRRFHVLQKPSTVGIHVVILNVTKLLASKNVGHDVCKDTQTSLSERFENDLRTHIKSDELLFVKRIYSNPRSLRSDREIDQEPSRLQ